MFGDNQSQSPSRSSRSRVGQSSRMRKMTPLKPMPLEAIAEENSRMESMNDVTQREQSNPFDAMRALQNQNMEVPSDILSMRQDSMEESSQNRWYKYYKSIGYSHEKLYSMGLTQTAEVSNAVTVKAAMTRLKKQNDLEKKNAPKAEPQLVPPRIGQGI